MILVDTGPLVALLRRNDRHHTACVQALREAREPLGTVWPVVTEAMHLLSSWRAQDALLEMVHRQNPRLLPLGPDDVDRIRDLVKKYRDLPMDLADAALVHVAGRDKCQTVFTLDRRDFAVYRSGGRALRLIP